MAASCDDYITGGRQPHKTLKSINKKPNQICNYSIDFPLNNPIIPRNISIKQQEWIILE